MYLGVNDTRNITRVGVPGLQTNNRAHMCGLLHALQVSHIIICFIFHTHSENYVLTHVIYAPQICARLNVPCCIMSCCKLMVRVFRVHVVLLKQHITLTLTQTDAVNNIDTLRRSGWLKSNGTPMANLDLWKCIRVWHEKCKYVTVKHVPRNVFCEGNSQAIRKRFRKTLRRLISAA